MKTKNFFAAMCGVFLLAGATIATYTAVTKSQKEMSDLTKQNLAILAQDEQPDVKDCVCDPQYECWSLHPTDPNKDIVIRQARWK